MENEPKGESDLETLIRITTAGFERMDARFAAVDTEFASVRADMTAGFSAVNKRIDNLAYTVDQLDAKVERYHQETKTDLTAIRGTMGGMSHTLGDHEERLKALEGE